MQYRLFFFAVCAIPFLATSAVVQPKVISKFAFGSAAAPTVGSVVNGASFQAGPVSAGETIAIFGSNLGPAAGAGAQIDSSGKLSGNVAGVQVLFGSTAAPLVYVSATQIDAMVPYEVLGKSSAIFTVVYTGRASAPISLQVASAVPALFTANEQGAGLAAIYNEDSTVNSENNPAATNSIVSIFGTGEGQLSPPGITGYIVPKSGPYPLIAGALSVTIGGASTSSFPYYGSIPGFVEGIFQINVPVPTGIPSGNQPLVVTVDGVQSPANVSVWIK